MFRGVGIFAFVFLFSAVSFAVDIVQIEKDLTSKGVEGWIHGSVKEEGLYVFTYRNPDNFFDYIEMSLVSFDPLVTANFSKLSRNDKVRIQGRFLPNPSPQKHIEVKSIEAITPYQPEYPSAPYKREAELPKDLLASTHEVFLVHAIAEQGKILVLEYKDAIVPIFVQDTSITKSLYRGDVVEVYFKIQKVPSEPTHLIIDNAQEDPIRILESIKDLDGAKGYIVGALVMFPKSPEIKFNVFAVQQKLQHGLTRQFTLVNFEKPEIFKAIREALQDAWDRHPKDYFNGRNKLISQKITIKATGQFNEVDPSQANPQILLRDLGAVEIIEEN